MHLKCSIAGDNYDTTLKEINYKTEMRLTINQINEEHFGTYHCVSKNSLGATDGTIKVYSKLLLDVTSYLN